MKKIELNFFYNRFSKQALSKPMEIWINEKYIIKFRSFTFKTPQSFRKNTHISSLFQKKRKNKKDSSISPFFFSFGDVQTTKNFRLTKNTHLKWGPSSLKPDCSFSKIRFLIVWKKSWLRSPTDTFFYAKSIFLRLLSTMDSHHL